MKCTINLLFQGMPVTIYWQDVKRILKLEADTSRLEAEKNPKIQQELNDFFQRNPDKLRHKYVRNKSLSSEKQTATG